MAGVKVDFTPLDADLMAAIGANEAPLVDPARAVYTNRDLDLSRIKVVGFDMDYTLAIYKKQPMEQLQYDLTVERLIGRHGYPDEIRALRYDPTFIIRGLILDKRNGHLVKMDAHGRVGRCFYGRRALDRDEVVKTYANAKIRLGAQSFASVDTLFSMPEACLYANLVEHFQKKHDAGGDASPIARREDPEHELLGDLDTWKLFDDVRNSIDDIHRDGTLKSVIMADLPKYFEVDDGLALALHKLRSAGKRLFLLTNSFWVYTQAVMSFLLDGRMKEYANWRAYFDIVIVGGKKPRFFTDREPFHEVDDAAVGEEKVRGEVSVDDGFARGKVYQGGNIEAFEKMAHAQGEEILYVGDHIFGDILRSKKDSRWRTCLVVEELEPEIMASVAEADTIEALTAIDTERLALDEAIGHHRALLAQIELALEERGSRGIDDGVVARLEDAAKRLRREVDQAKRALRALDKTADAHQESLDARFNPWWGRLLKEHSELSRFGAQVELYACTYTSRVSNFLHYSPMHYFRAPRELMSHDVGLTERTSAGRSRRARSAFAGPASAAPVVSQEGVAVAAEAGPRRGVG